MTQFRRFRITKAATSPVRINVNGKPASFPLGLEHDLDSVPGLTREEVLGALDGSNVEYELVGEAPAPAVDALVEAGGAGGITAPSAESAPGEKIDATGPISAPSAGFSKGEDVEAGKPPMQERAEALGERSGSESEDESAPSDDEPMSDEHREKLLSLLDKSIPDVEAELAGLDATELAILYAAEKDGKSRKGVIAAIEAKFAEQGEPK